MVKVMAPKTIILSSCSVLSSKDIYESLEANPRQIKDALSVTDGNTVGTLSFFKKQHKHVSWFVVKTAKETVYVFTDQGKFKFAGRLRTKLGKNVLEVWDDIYFTVLSKLTDSQDWSVPVHTTMGY